MRFGMPIPERIQNAPELEQTWQLYYQGFLDLNSTRDMGMAMGPISYMTMVEYCLMNEIYGEQQQDFIWIVARLDQRYLKRSNKDHGGPQGPSKIS